MADPAAVAGASAAVLLCAVLDVGDEVVGQVGSAGVELVLRVVEGAGGQRLAAAGCPVAVVGLQARPPGAEVAVVTQPFAELAPVAQQAVVNDLIGRLVAGDIASGNQQAPVGQQPHDLAQSRIVAHRG